MIARGKQPDKRLRIPETERHQSATRNPKSAMAVLLLGLCLCVLAIRVTYTESPTVQTSTLPMSLGDTLYSLTLSGLLILGVIVWFLRGALAGRLSYHVTGMEIGLGLFVAAAAVSTWTAADKRLALSQTFMLLGPLLAAVLMVQLLRALGRTRVVLVVIAALGIVSVYQCVEQLAVSNRVTIDQYEKDPSVILEPMGIASGTLDHFLLEHRIYARGVRGFFTTSNSAASFGLLACLAAVALLAERYLSRRDAPAGGRTLLYPAGAAVLLAVGLFLTQSKGGILSFGFALLLFLGLLAWQKQPPARRKALLVAGAALGTVAVIAIVSAVVWYGARHSRLPGGNSMLVRWQYWAASVRMIADHPWTGVGPGNFATHYTRYKPAGASESVADPHCLPLSLLAQYGPLGLIGFLALVFVPLGRSLSTLLRGASAAPACWPVSRRTILLTLAALCVCLLFVRPILIPLPPGNSLETFVYDLVSLYVAPAAAFLIGFMLLVVPLGAARTMPGGKATSVVLALLSCAVVGVLLHNLIDFALFEPGVWMTFWIIVACVACLARGEETETDTDGRYWDVKTARRKVLCVGIATAICGGYLAFVWAPVLRTTVAISQAREDAAIGQIDAAHRLLDDAVGADPLSSMASNLNGNLYLQQSEQPPQQAEALRRATECFEQAVRINPADYKNYEKTGLALSLQGQDQQAYEWYTKAAALYPGNERLQLRLGQIAERLGKREVALVHYRRTIEIENAFRTQFGRMYPTWKKPVSRLGESDYQLAQQRIKELSRS